jgi:hydroxylysine kinase
MHAEITQTTIQKMLTTTPPAFSAEDAVSIAARHFGIHGKTRLLVSERDQNFRLDADDGNRYTLKISNDAEQLQVIDFQNRALLYAEKQDASLPLPRVIPTLDAKLHCSVEHNGKTHFVRVLSWLDGMLLDDAVVDAALANRLGRLLARMGLALKDFDHPGSNPPSLWDMKRAAGLRDLLPYIEDPVLGQLISQTLDRFVSAVKPSLDTLRTQVIHCDMNLGNVLVDEIEPDRIVGLIDFGDMVKSPLIIDLAVAAAYQLSDGDDPLSGVLPMIAGYHAICPLQDLEMELLTDLIRTRLVTSLLINSYRVTLFPENRDYLMISHAPAKIHLINLSRQNTDESLRRIRSACDSA